MQVDTICSKNGRYTRS